MLDDKVSSALGITMASLTLFISCFQICQHLRNYSELSFQRYIIRIIFLVPFYSVSSCFAMCFALHYRDHSIYFEVLRDCYVAWVIYNFMCLCMAYIGGPGAVVVNINDVTADIMHQINPSYVSYVLYHDGGPEKNVKMKKFRGGGASKEKENFSGLHSQSAMLPAFQPKRKGAGMNFSDEELAGNEDGATWYGGKEIGANNPLNRVLPKAVVTGLNVGLSTATHVVGKATGLAERTGEQLVQWIPGITEQESNQAELLDSDSDAAYDEENVRDNQIDDDMVLNDDEDSDGESRDIHRDEEAPQDKPDTLKMLQETFGALQAVTVTKADEAAFDDVFGTGLSAEEKQRLASSSG